MKTVKFTQTPAEYFESRNGGKSAEKMMDDDEMITPTYALTLISEYVLDCAKFIESDMSHPPLPSKEQVIGVLKKHSEYAEELVGCVSIEESKFESIASEILSLSPDEGKEEKHLTDKNIAVEIIARFLGNPHPNQKKNYDREKIAFANGMKAARDFYEGKNTKG